MRISNIRHLVLVACLPLIGCGTSGSSEPVEESVIAGSAWRDKYRYRKDGREHFAIPILIADLEGSDPVAQIRAAKVIPYEANSSFDKTLGPLIHLLSSDDERVQQAAAEGISHLTTRQGVDVAIAPLKRVIEGSGSERTKRWAVIALADLGPRVSTEKRKELVDVYITICQHSSRDVAQFAFTGLANLGELSEPAIPVLLKQMQVPDRKFLAINAIGEIAKRPDLCIPALVNALKTPSSDSDRILEAIAQFSAEATVPVIPTFRRYLRSGNGRIVIAAAVGLARIGVSAESAADDLYSAFKSRSDAKGTIRDEARIVLFYALTKIGPAGQKIARDLISNIHTLRLIESTAVPVSAGQILQFVAGTDSIRILHLSGARLTDEQLGPIASLKGLEEISLAGSTNASSLRHLSGLSELRVIKQDLFGRREPNSAMSDLDLRLLRDCQRLEHLRLRVNLLGDGLKNLANSPNLKSLEVNQVSDAGIQALPALLKLESFSVLSGDLSDAGLSSLSRLPALKRLGLTSTKISDLGIAALAQNHSGLTHLNLAHTQVTQQSVKSLSKLTGLQQLIVYNTPLAGNRDVLNMGQTAGVVELIRQLPECSVVYAD